MKPKEGFVKFKYENLNCVGRVYNTDPENHKDGVWMIATVDENGWTTHINFETAEDLKT